MSKSELKRTATMNPIAMAERVAEIDMSDLETEAFEIIGYWLPCKDATGSVILDYQDDGYEPLYRRKELK